MTSARELSQDMPAPVSVIVLGRLTVDAGEQVNGLGRALLCDAVLRVAAAARDDGVAALFVHALNDRAKTFYVAAGFDPSPVDPIVLIVRVEDINAVNAIERYAPKCLPVKHPPIRVLRI